MKIVFIATRCLLRNIKKKKSSLCLTREGSSMDSLVPKQLGTGKVLIQSYSIDSYYFGASQV